MQNQTVYNSVPPIIELIDHDSFGNRISVKYIREDKLVNFLWSIESQLNEIRNTFCTNVEENKNDS